MKKRGKEMTKMHGGREIKIKRERGMIGREGKNI